MSCRCCPKGVSSYTPHTPLTCSYRIALYCSVCADKGHSPNVCPNLKAVACRRGEDPSLVENRVLTVLHSHAAIRHVLQLNGIAPLPTMEENKALLKQFAYSLPEPKMVVYKLL